MLYKASIMLIRLSLAALLAAPTLPALHQALSPWDAAVVCCTDSPFVGPVGQILGVVAIVVGGLLFAFAKGESKQVLAGIVFGLGMLIWAANFVVWLFPI